MAAVPLISLKTQRYGGRVVAAGELFYVRTGDEARVLKALQFAADAPPPPVPPLTSVNGSAPTEGDVIDEADTEDASPTAPKKRTYKRKDVTAEE